MLYNLYLDIWWYVWNCEIFLDLWIFLRFSLVYCLANRLCRSGPTTTLSSRSIPKLLRNQLRLRRRRIQQASPNPQQHSTMCVLDKSGNVDNIWEFTFRNVNEPHRITMYINVHQCTFFVVSRPHSCDVSCSFFDATIRRIGTWGMAQKNPGGIAGSLPESTPSVDPATRDMSLRFSGRSASFHGYVQYYD